jgi:hypothetical protein
MLTTPYIYRLAFQKEEAYTPAEFQRRTYGTKLSVQLNRVIFKCRH